MFNFCMKVLKLSGNLWIKLDFMTRQLCLRETFLGRAKHLPERRYPNPKNTSIEPLCLAQQPPPQQRRLQQRCMGRASLSFAQGPVSGSLGLLL